MNYTPFAGNLKKYGQGPEHNFFPQAPAAASTAAGAGSPAFDAAMRTLGVISTGATDFSGNSDAKEAHNSKNAAAGDPDVDPGSRLGLSLSNPTLGAVVGNVFGGTLGGIAGGAVGGLMDVSRANSIAQDSQVNPVDVNGWEAAARGATGPIGGWMGLRSAYEQNFDNLAGNMALGDEGWDAAWGADESDEADAAAQQAAIDAISGSGYGSDPFGGHDPSAGSGSSSASDPGDMAAGGPVGSVEMHNGGFVIPADVVSGLGDGSTEAGYRRLGIGKLIRGPGTGMSDDIPANIDGSPEAKVADGEVYVNPKEVKLLGGGNPTKGMRRLEALLDEVRSKRHGTTEQPKPLSLGAIA
jgi:hypothetical protein